MAPPLTDLIEDVTAEILLRLPPDEPEHLFRAALVCKPWLRILCDAGFLRRYRAFHGAPPLLDHLHIRDRRGRYGEPFPRLVPTTSVPAFPQPAGAGRSFTRLLDCRHGRVLVLPVDGSAGDMNEGDHGYLVWDPVTGETHALPQPEDIPWTWRHYTAAVSCAAQGCNHLDCHGSPFLAFLAAHANAISASTYVSETGAWSTPTSVCIGSAFSFYAMRGTLLGNDQVHFALAFPQTDAFATVKYDLGKNRLSVMKSPLPHRKVYFALMAMEDTSLGLAVSMDSSLCIYSRKVNTDGDAQWMPSRVIDLEKVMPMAKPGDGHGACAVGFAEGVGAIFVSTAVGLFTIELKSGKVKKVGKPVTGYVNYFSVLPYMSFYTPDCGRLASLITGFPDV